MLQTMLQPAVAAVSTVLELVFSASAHGSTSFPPPGHCSPSCQTKTHTSASARSISHHMPPVDDDNSAIPGAIPSKMGEDLSEMWPNCRAKFHADR